MWDRAARARQIGEDDLDLAQVAERDDSEGDRFVFAGERLGSEGVNALAPERRIVGEHVLHRVALEDDEAPATLVVGRP